MLACPNRRQKIEPGDNHSGQRMYVLSRSHFSPRRGEMLMPLHVLSRNSQKQISQHGQGMLEYALIIFLIAVVAILGIVFLVPVIINGISGVLPAL
jgi:Flp pilus assembly pilin Flp